MRLVHLAVQRPVTIWMFTLGIMLFGFVAMSRLAVNLLPDLSYPSLTIRTEYVGAAPAEVEQLISKPIEESVGVVKGVRKVHSVSRAGRSDVMMEFEWGTDMDLAGLDVREKLDVLWLPLDAKKPTVLRFNPNLDPVLRFALTNPDAPSLTNAQLVALRTYADEELRRHFEGIAGVAAVKPDGGLTQEIQVLIDNEKLSQLNLDIQQINSRLVAQNLNQAGGRLETSQHDYLVRTMNQFTTLDEMRQLYIATVNGSQIKLQDIAVVQDGFMDRQSITYVDGQPAIEIAIYKEGDANTVQVAERVLAELPDIRSKLPPGYELTLIYDQSTFIGDAIAEVKSSAVIGGLLSMLVIYLFLRQAWSTLIIAITIPLSVIATFNLMHAQNISLNMMSLGGIALAIGMLVDNAIVVLENISRYKEQGYSAMEAAKKGASEVSSAIVASTLTTVAVFVPLIFVEGVAGQLFRDQALTVTYALLASLLLALTLIPTMAGYSHNSAMTAELTAVPSSPNQTSRVRQIFSWPLRVLGQLLSWLCSAVFFLWRLLAKGGQSMFYPMASGVAWLLQRMEKAYRQLLEWALHAKAKVMFATLLLAMLCFSLIPKLGFDVLPSLEQGEFYLEIQLPIGSSIEKTDEILTQLASIAATHPSVIRTYGQAGTGQQMQIDPAIGGSHWGRLNLVLADDVDSTTAEQVRQFIREKAAKLPEVVVKIAEPQLLQLSKPLEIEFAGYELPALTAVSEQFVARLAQDPRFIDVKSTLRAGQPEISLHFDQQRLSQLGLTAADISKRVANYVGGEIAGQFTISDRKVDIRVRLAAADRNSIQQLAQIIINPQSATPLPLAAVADIRHAIGPSEITRINQQRVAVVSAQLAFGDIEQASAVVNAILLSTTLPFGVEARLTGQSEELTRSYQSLLMALALAVFLVYLVMASQFENLLQPLLILFTVPLAGAGAVLGLWLTDTSVSVLVFIGLIMLAGIVVNNAIVLIDRINQLRAMNYTINDAVIEAGVTRLRPVLMTTLTTVLGLTPMLFGGEGAEMRTPMAITVIFGLSLATVLTLVVIPVLYRLTNSDQRGQSV